MDKNNLNGPKIGKYSTNDIKYGIFIIYTRIKIYFNSSLRLGRIFFKKVNPTTIGNNSITNIENHNKKSEIYSKANIPRVQIKSCNTGRPIIFIHKSNSYYLKYSLAQAAVSNPESKIYLLGDEDNDCYKFVEHHHVKDYYTKANHFAKHYVHRSTNSRNFEMFCFQRWFVLAEFLKSKNINECFLLDSDVMLYADITKSSENFKLCDFTLARLISGHTMFINNVNSLNEFNEFVMRVYTGKDMFHYDNLLGHYYATIKNDKTGGVSDMTLLQFFHKQFNGLIGDTSIIIDGSIYDQSINISEPGFEMKNGIKNLKYEDGFYYGYHKKSGCNVRFNSLHFQSRESKKLMAHYLAEDLVNSIR